MFSVDSSLLFIFCRLNKINPELQSVNRLKNLVESYGHMGIWSFHRKKLKTKWDGLLSENPPNPGTPTVLKLQCANVAKEVLKVSFQSKKFESNGFSIIHLNGHNF